MIGVGRCVRKRAPDRRIIGRVCVGGVTDRRRSLCASTGGCHGHGRRLLDQDNGDQSRRINPREDAVQGVARQVEHLTRTKQLAGAFPRDLDLTFEALDGDLALNPVRRERLASHQHKANDFKCLGLEQRSCPFPLQTGTKRSDIDWLTRACVRDRHDPVCAGGIASATTAIQPAEPARQAGPRGIRGASQPSENATRCTGWSLRPDACTGIGQRSHQGAPAAVLARACSNALSRSFPASSAARRNASLASSRRPSFSSRSPCTAGSQW